MIRSRVFVGVAALMVGMILALSPGYAQQDLEEFIIEGVERHPGLSVYDDSPPGVETNKEFPTRDYPLPDEIEPPSEELELVRTVRSPLDQTALDQHYQREGWDVMSILYILVGVGLGILLL